MGDAADRRIAELEESERVLKANSKWLNDTIDDMSKTIASLRKQLVERDVYEAQQILPPEQAALIKHLATVERCLDEGREEFSGYDIEVRCTFCQRGEGETHNKDCAWLALQFDRKPEATMTMVHEHALNEHETWERRQKPAISAWQQWLAHPLAMRENNIGPLPEVAPLSAEDALRRARIAVEESRERLMAQPFHGVNVVPAYSPRDPEISHAFSVLPPEARPVAPNLGIGGEEPTEVAPPDDEDVP